MNARSKAVALLRAKNATTGEHTMEMGEVLEHELKGLRAIDTTFDIEIGWMRYLCNEGGRKHLVALAVEHLPGPNHDLGLTESIAGIEQVKSGSVYKYSSTSAQCYIDGIAAWLAKLKDGIAPTCPEHCEQHLLQVWLQLPLFLQAEEIVHQEQATKEEEGQLGTDPAEEPADQVIKHRGMKAFKYLWGKVEHGPPETTDLDELNRLVPFTAFATPDERSLVRARVNACLASNAKAALAKFPDVGTASSSKKPKPSAGEESAKAIFGM
eukprot:4164404-Amphidinium_carterae.1